MDRYPIHDLLRRYAEDKARNEEPSQDRKLALRSLLVWYLHSADAAATAMGYNPHRIELEPLDPHVTPMSFHGQDEALAWYITERANLVAATKAAADNGFDKMAWQIPAVMREIYSLHYLFNDWIQTGRIGLAAARRLDDRLGESVILESLGKAADAARDSRLAAEYHTSALEIRRELRDIVGQARSMNALGLAYLHGRDLPAAKAQFEDTVEFARQMDIPHWEAVALANVGEVYTQLGQVESAIDTLQHALSLHRQRANKYFEFECLHSLSRAYRQHGAFDEAFNFIQDAMAISLELENPVYEGSTLIEIGHLQLHVGVYEDALKAYREAIIRERSIGDRGREGVALFGAARAFHHLDRSSEANGYLRNAISILREVGDSWQMARCLVVLGEWLRESASVDEALAFRNEAATILSRYSDPESVEFHSRALAIAH
jgi:tetratricopeptide (TPR) repeat protein